MARVDPPTDPPVANAPAVRRWRSFFVGVASAMASTILLATLARLFTSSFTAWAPTGPDLVITLGVGLSAGVGFLAAFDILPSHPLRDQTRHEVLALSAGAIAGAATILATRGAITQWAGGLGTCAVPAVLPPVATAISMVMLVRWRLSMGAMDLLVHGSRCRRCGYDLRGSREPRCPECGTWRR